MSIEMIYNIVFVTVCFFAGFFIGRWYQRENREITVDEACDALRKNGWKEVKCNQEETADG